MKSKTFSVFLFFSFCIVLGMEGQKPNKQQVMKNIRLVADNVVKNTTYMFYDNEEGIFVHDIEKHGYIRGKVFPQSPYNDWKYWNGVLHLGFNALGAETKEPKYIHYARKNFEFLFKDFDYFKSIYKGDAQWTFHMAQAVDVTELDDCGAMGASLIELYNIDPRPEYKRYIDEATELMRTKQYRLEDGIYCRKKPHTYTVWADDLFMCGPFLVRMGNMTGDNKFYDEAIRQVILFNKYLFDERTGLMWHCYYSDLKKVAGTYWGRCNGWIMYATVDILQHLPEEYPGRDTLIRLLERQILNVAQYQHQSGLWHQVLHKPDSYLETSCTAMFTYSIALAVRKAWIDSRYLSIAQAGWCGIATQIQRDGGVTNICTGTPVGNDLKFYYDRPAPYNDIHALGAIILAGLEVFKSLS